MVSLPTRAREEAFRILPGKPPATQQRSNEESCLCPWRPRRFLPQLPGLRLRASTDEGSESACSHWSTTTLPTVTKGAKACRSCKENSGGTEVPEDPAHARGPTTSCRVKLPRYGAALSRFREDPPESYSSHSTHLGPRLTVQPETQANSAEGPQRSAPSRGERPQHMES